MVIALFIFYLSVNFILILKTIYHNIIFFCFQQRSIRGFQSSLNLDNVLSLIKAVHFAISASSMIFTIHFFILGKVLSFFKIIVSLMYDCIIYKSKPHTFFSSCLSLNPKRKKRNIFFKKTSGFNCT